MNVENRVRAHEVAEQVLTHPELAEGMTRGHIDFLAQILEVSDYPDVRDVAWVDQMVCWHFGNWDADYMLKSLPWAYMISAINAVTLFKGEFPREQ